ncbi:MAG: IS3 family transposase [Spirosomataceae bacterium]
MRRTPNKPSHVLQVEERGRDGTAGGQAPTQGTRTGKPPPQKDVRRAATQARGGQRGGGVPKKEAGPAAKVELMGHVQGKQAGLSKRRICQWLRLRRSTAYEQKERKSTAMTTDWATHWVERMKQIRREHPAWGFRLMLAYLKNQGEGIGRHRAYRLYQSARLSLHRNPKKPRIKRVFEGLLPPEKINEGWAMDFLSEWVMGDKQQSVRIINVVDECSRKDLWVEAAASITAPKLVETLDRIGQIRGFPRYVRCDNGPEFISQALAGWAAARGVEIKFIQPGKPTQNGIIERLNGTLRKECLNLNWFYSLEEINDLLTTWHSNYNFLRPHSCLKYQTPANFEKLNQNLYFKLVP